jgi:isopenicillin-N epimerase
MPSPLSAHWSLDPNVTFLNHGSFGACPRVVLEAQQRWRERLEHNPVQFLSRQLFPLLDASRARVAAFVGAPVESLAFVRNATEGANAVLRSIALAPNDEVVTTNHDYNAIRNVLNYVCSRSGAKLVVAEFPFPLSGPDAVVAAVVNAFTPGTRLLAIDHVTSPTGLVLPIEAIVAEARARNIVTFVDGAHAPGMIPLSIRAIGADYYTGNLHKWVCAPKGAAFLYIKGDARERTLPPVISHGYNLARPGRRYLDNFEWQGTFDPTAWLTVPTAIDTMASLHPDGWPGVMLANRTLALEARDILARALGIDPPAPDAMVGSLAALPIPDGGLFAPSPLGEDPTQLALFEQFGIEVPLLPWPKPPKRLVRVSAQLYNAHADYERLAQTLGSVL